MKSLLFVSMFIPTALCAMQEKSIVQVITDQFVQKDRDKVVLTPIVAQLLRNDGLYTDTTDSIPLADAVQQTQATWCNKEWNHTATEEDKKKAARIDNGMAIIQRLHRPQIIANWRNANIAIGHAGVLPSVIKMFLAMNDLYFSDDTTKLTVVLSNEPFNNQAIENTPLASYDQAGEIVHKLNEKVTLPAVVDASKPKTQKDVVELVRIAFADAIPDLEVTYVNKEILPAYAQSIKQKTRVAVVSSYPQLEAHALTFAALTKKNPNFDVITAYTAGECKEFEPLYDTQSKEEEYNFVRNNFARVLYRIQENMTPESNDKK